MYYIRMPWVYMGCYDVRDVPASLMPFVACSCHCGLSSNNKTARCTYRLSWWRTFHAIVSGATMFSVALSSPTINLYSPTSIM